VHSAGVVVGDVTLHFAPRSLLGFIGGEELAESLALTAESLDRLFLVASLDGAVAILRRTAPAGALSLASITLRVRGDLLFELGLDLREFVPQIAEGAAVLARGIGRQFEPIKAEVTAAQQAFFVQIRSTSLKTAVIRPSSLPTKSAKVL
jgi:hypothetical protein